MQRPIHYICHGAIFIGDSIRLELEDDVCTVLVLAGFGF